ncbi:esterase [Flavihumibacter sp. R14]|nr:esterase [Flavihumibacter soli]
MPDHSFDVFPFKALDGFNCNLWRLKGDHRKDKGVVMLVHGAGVRSNIFNPPNRKNLLNILAGAGYDVWLENWRGSTECRKNEWNLDQVAINDHPAAVQEICRITGVEEMNAIIHCQGSTSFMISAVQGLVPQVKTVISNAVSLHPVVPEFSAFKLNYIVPIVKPITKYLNPQWADDAPDLKAKAFRTLVRLTHHEEDTDVGKFVSFTYGTGFPALWELANLNTDTKEWIRNEFGNVPLSFFDHIKKCVKKGALVSANGKIDYTSFIPRTDARFVFLTGKLNKCFCSRSQENTFRYFDKLRPGYHHLYKFNNYSHLDIFLGKNAINDIFPTILEELNN